MDIQGIRDFFADVGCWDKVYQSNDVDTCLDQILTVIKQGIDRHVPIRKDRLKPVKHCLRYVRPEWINNRTIAMYKKKQKKWEFHKRTKNNSSYTSYTELVNQIEEQVKTTRLNYEMEIAREGRANPKRITDYIKRAFKKGNGYPVLKNRKGEIITSNKKKATIFQKQFLAAFRSNCDEPECEDFFADFWNHVEVEVNRENTSTIEDIVFTHKLVSEVLASVDPNKSMDQNNCHPKLIKECHAELTNPILYLFQLSYDQGKLPELWKISKVTPVFKKGDRGDPMNYRPISTGSLLCKCMEKIIHNSINSFMEKHNLHSPYQHGFTPGRSCSTNLLTYYRVIQKLLRDHPAVYTVFLDIARAFDSVPHNVVIHSARRVGVIGKTISWIENYFEGRKQFVNVEGELSSVDQVTSGVPQGSTLAPVLFNIVMARACEGVSGGILLFADDAKLFSANIDQLQRDLDRMASNLEQLGLAFNVSKCRLMVYGRSDTAGLKYGNVTITNTKYHIDLGITLADDRKWTKNCTAFNMKANLAINRIKKCFQYKDKKLISKLYKTYIRPHIEYGGIVCRPYLQKDIDLLEAIPRRSTRLAFSDRVDDPRYKPYDQRLKDLKLPSLSSRFDRADLIFTFKIMTGRIKIDRDLFFTPKIRRPGDHIYAIYKERPANNWEKGLYWFRIVERWNSLPGQVVEAVSVNSFKNRLDQHMGWL